MQKPKLLPNLSKVKDKFEGFIIDQWGVIHDGEKVYPGVKDFLLELRVKGKEVLILSNSGKSSLRNKERLQKLGINNEHFSEVITSGEVTRLKLISKNEDYYKNLGSKCYLISRQNEKSILSGTEFTVVENIEAADFILICGLNSNKPTGYYENILKSAAFMNLPAICANPDTYQVSGKSILKGVSYLAKWYEVLGGCVKYEGKPYPDIYINCLKWFNERGINKNQILAVGDSIDHDILGGNQCGLQTCLVRTGLPVPNFKNGEETSAFFKSYDQISKHDPIPTYLADQLNPTV